MLTLRVGVAGEEPPLTVTLSPPCTIEQLHDAIYNATTLTRSKHRLRLISAGKLLPPQGPLAAQGITNNAYIHCGVSDKPLIPKPSSPPDETRLLLDPAPQPQTHDFEQGTIGDFVWGAILGTTLGLIMLIVSMDRSIALSRRWKAGIVAGAVANVLFGIYLLATQRNTN